MYICNLYIHILNDKKSAQNITKNKKLKNIFSHIKRELIHLFLYIFNNFNCFYGICFKIILFSKSLETFKKNLYIKILILYKL